MSDSPLPLPPPPVPGDLDLRAFPKMFVDTGVVLGSALADVEKTPPDAFRAAMLLQFMCWQSVPAASLPYDERRLAAMIGVSAQRWKTIREAALNGFVLCSDRRLYHRSVVEEALNASAYRSKQSARAKKRWQPQGSLDLSGEKDATALPHRSGSSFLLPSPLETAEAFVVPQWVPRESWAAFVHMRQTIKAPLTALAAKLIITELTKISGPTGADAGAILELSARNNWKDVYALKNRPGGTASPTDLRSRNSAAAAAFAAGTPKP